MSYILFKKVERLADPTNKDLGKKTFPTIVYKYGSSMTMKELAAEISEKSGMTRGQVTASLNDVSAHVKKVLLSGRSVNIDGLGYFFLAAQSKGTENREAFTAADITGLRICFRANNDIRLHTGASTRTSGLKLKDVDKLNETDTDPGTGDSGDGGDIVDPGA